MVSSYTTNKNLEKPGNGDYVDTWNIPVNGDMDVIDAAFGGVTSLNATSGSANLTSTQYQKMALNVTGAMTANVTYTIPNGIGGTWVVRNATTDSTGGPWTITIASGGGGSNVSVIRGRSTMVWSDGTNIRDVSENIPSIGTVTSVDVSGGTTGLTTTGGPITTNGTIVFGGTLGTANGGTGLTALGNGVQTFLAYPSSANLAAAVTDETGTGKLVFSNNAVLVSPSFSTIINTGTLNLPTSNTTLIGTDTTNTLTNKRITARISSSASASSPFAWNSDNFDEYVLTALANDLTINADSGTPTEGQKIIFSITDNGVSKNLAWTTGSTNSFRAAGVTPPAATVAGKVVYVGFIYNSAAARWDCVASSQET